MYHISELLVFYHSATDVYSSAWDSFRCTTTHHICGNTQSARNISLQGGDDRDFNRLIIRPPRCPICRAGCELSLLMLVVRVSEDPKRLFLTWWLHKYCYRYYCFE